MHGDPTARCNQKHCQPKNFLLFACKWPSFCAPASRRGKARPSSVRMRRNRSGNGSPP